MSGTPETTDTLLKLATWLQERGTENGHTRFDEGRRNSLGIRPAECTVFDADAHFVFNNLTGSAAQKLGEAIHRRLSVGDALVSMLRECRAAFAFAADEADTEAAEFVALIDAVLAKAGAA